VTAALSLGATVALAPAAVLALASIDAASAPCAPQTANVSDPTAGALPLTEVARAAQAAGFTGEDLVTAVAVVMPESGANPLARNPSGALGLWQILDKAHPQLVARYDWRDPAQNAQMAFQVYAAAGRTFRPWEAFTKRLHVPYLEQARAAVQQVGVTLPGMPLVGCDVPFDPAGAPTTGPGQWGGHQNGRIPLPALCPVPGTAVLLRCDAARSFTAMSAAYAQTFGRPIVLTDGYRDYAGQVSCRAGKGDLCADPGTSNHGWALAADLGGGIQTFGTAAHEWMRANGRRFGWHHPRWAQRGGSKPEAWHWEFGAGAAA
jgi:hypothetical protein